MRRAHAVITAITVGLAVVSSFVLEINGVLIGSVVVVGGELVFRLVALHRAGAPATESSGDVAASTTRRTLDRLRRRFRRRPARATGFASYTAILSDLAWSRSNRRDFDRTLRGRLLGIARVRLADRHGVDLDRDVDTARRLLGETAWTVLRPGEQTATDHREPGLTVRELTPVVEALERL